MLKIVLVNLNYRIGVHMNFAQSRIPALFCSHNQNAVATRRVVCEDVMIYELVLRNFNCSLEFVFSLLLLQPFNFSPVSFACNIQD